MRQAGGLARGGGHRGEGVIMPSRRGTAGDGALNEAHQPLPRWDS